MGHGVGMLLLAAIGGYWVIERAQTHKAPLKKFGQFLGGLIIAVSLIGVACRVWYLASCVAAKGGYCPYPFKASSPKAESQ